MKPLRLTKPLRARIRDGHPWIYDRACAPLAGVAPGELVLVTDEDGPIAVALVDPASPIRARVLDHDPRAALDAAWTIARTQLAAERRTRDPLLVGCTARRLVHGEADACPGLVIDAYDDTAVVVFDGPAAMAFWRPRLGDAIAGLVRGGQPIAHVWVRGERGKRAHGEAFAGDPPAEIQISEDEARFAIDVRAGQKTGFFLDQRDNRRIVRRHAAGASVLNLYCYTGGFSLHAALGGARHVTSVDIAAPAIADLKKNVALSGLDTTAHETACEDVFEFLARAQAKRRRWDLVICDPPSFAPNEKARGSALGAYRRLAAAALAVTEPTGRLAVASCSSHVTEADLLAACPPLRVRAITGAASDHPVLAAFPEGRYLKFLLFDAS